MKTLEKRAAVTQRRLWIVTGILAAFLAGWQIFAAMQANTLKPLVARAITADGTPLAGVRVQFVQETATDEDPAYVATTGADGAVPLPPNIIRDRFYLLAKNGDGVLSQGFGQRELANEIIFEPASLIQGMVSNEFGLPLDGAAVSIRFGDENAPVLVSAISDKEGEFRFDNVSRSLDFLYVEARKAGYAPLSIEWTRSDEPISLELEPALDLRIRVFLPNGRPAADRAVRIDNVGSTETHTDDEGRATFTGLRRDLAYSVTIADPRLTYFRESLEPSTKVHRIDLCVPASIDGHVIDQQGLPLAGVEVRHGHGPRRWVRATTDENGVFHLGDVPAGRIEIFYESGGRVGNTLARVEAGKDIHDFVIRVEPE